MANLDLASVWSTVKAATTAAQGGALNQSSLVDIAKDIVAGALSGAKSGAAQGSGIDYIGIAKQLISLYEKFKGSSDTTEKATAINVKEMIPKAEVTILERGHGVLRKVAVSGGGRCNVTNTFEGIGDLSEVYPRGHRLMRKLLQEFSPEDIFKWFEDRKVRLTAQSDHCVFPASQNSQTIIDCFESEARRLGVKIKTDVKEIDLDAMLNDGSIAVVCTGGITSHTILEQ